ncbi:MAG: hypothetical protein ACI9U2_004721, partial [Bradymonadia bacterium]
PPARTMSPFLPLFAGLGALGVPLLLADRFTLGVPGLTDAYRDQSQFLIYALVLGVMAVLQARAVRPIRRGIAGWHAEFAPQRASRLRNIVHLQGPINLRYEVIRHNPNWEWLSFERSPRIEVEISRNPSGIGDPVFDRVVGFTGTETQRALLGPTLRLNGPRWHGDAGFTLIDGQAKVRLGLKGYDDRATLQAICAAFGDYVDRLTAPPVVALAPLARDWNHPFDAARALALLSTHWPDDAAAVCESIADTPTGRAIARVACTGQGLLDPILDWPTRSAIGRGVLGTRKSPAFRPLRACLRAQTATDEASAMALIDLCEAGGVSPWQEAHVARSLAFLIQHGGPECLAWMQARARHDTSSGIALKTLSARLKDKHSGRLSLDDDAHAGQLSETRAGELSFTGAAPPA